MRRSAVCTQRRTRRGQVSPVRTRSKKNRADADEEFRAATDSLARRSALLSVLAAEILLCQRNGR